MLELLPTGGSARNMKFSWLLEGLDTDWSRPSELHFINYTNLPGGDFKLHIRMYDGSLSQIIDERSLNILLHPPFGIPGGLHSYKPMYRQLYYLRLQKLLEPPKTKKYQ